MCDQIALSVLRAKSQDTKAAALLSPFAANVALVPSTLPLACKHSKKNIETQPARMK